MTFNYHMTYLNWSCSAAWTVNCNISPLLWRKVRYRVRYKNHWSRCWCRSIRSDCWVTAIASFSLTATIPDCYAALDHRVVKPCHWYAGICIRTDYARRYYRRIAWTRRETATIGWYIGEYAVAYALLHGQHARGLNHRNGWGWAVRTRCRILGARYCYSIRSSNFGLGLHKCGAVCGRNADGLLSSFRETELVLGIRVRNRLYFLYRAVGDGSGRDRWQGWKGSLRLIMIARRLRIGCRSDAWGLQSIESNRSHGRTFTVRPNVWTVRLQKCTGVHAK